MIEDLGATWPFERATWPFEGALGAKSWPKGLPEGLSPIALPLAIGSWTLGEKEGGGVFGSWHSAKGKNPRALDTWPEAGGYTNCLRPLCHCSWTLGPDSQQTDNK